MRNKIIMIFVIVIAFLGGLVISKGLDIVQPYLWTKGSSTSQPNEPGIINYPRSTNQQYPPSGGGMMFSPMNPNYNPQYDWYTPPKNNGGYWCW
ncbi:hypothetical protein Desdi_1132 [Desulfitobacterium dichloroeliminans LMG P-21439]|uniref:Uncharacterized protein n=1 Tax=Desulfitobacterium dichloroeliminans (strain LMG P-21439 / DCA1) TaxID=871963 RepID=L0F641_DESDL|nr:hypothetical protein Desdi_1132 [Desulfitobacterium dichloroeliminans LMG P-21439]